LQAIRNKDPRVYDEKATFYKKIKDDDEESDVKKAEKPMYLRDYHRENLLSGYTGAEESDSAPAPRTFAQEQEDLRNTVVKEMHAAAEADNSSESGLEGVDGGFLVPKTKIAVPKENARGSMTKKITVDPTNADKDPETFLSNFMASRAWVSTDGAKFQPFESDDEEEDERAEMFEAAYNLRFEDPKSSNEVLRSYARDVVLAKSVRREELKSRKRQRKVERERKEAGKREREEERARLRRLKIEEMEEKLEKIKKAAGLKLKTLQEEEWTKFLEEDWDDDRWEAEMNKRFGNDYYIDQELGSEDDGDAGETNGSGKKKKKPKKPRWDDDIDIKDIIPEFEEEAAKGLSFTLSDSEVGVKDGEDASEDSSRKLKSAKDREQEKLAKKKTARLERKKIEELVDSRMDLEDPVLGKSKQPTRFRYRETSPISFGLTPRDILMASDASLNQFAGLKKMASFRDPEKKRKDKKRLGKKARLREWRRETFGNEEGPEIIIGNAPPAGGASSIKNTVVSGNIIEGKKRHRQKKRALV
jgi:protein KRI1